MLGVSISSPNSPAAERPYSPQDRFSSTHPSWVRKIRLTSRLQCYLPVFVLLSHRLTVVIWISSCSHISGCVFVSSSVEIYATFLVYISPVVFMYSPSECLSASCFSSSSQDENSSVCNQRVDFLQKMLFREQQELQVSITITATYCSHSVFLWAGSGKRGMICTVG